MKMLKGILEDRVYNFILNNPDYIIETPPQIYIKNTYNITIKFLVNYIQEHYSDNNLLIKQIESYLWNNYIWKHSHKTINNTSNHNSNNIKIC